ncbi:hypothetical protein ACIPL2_35100, partial [Pseudomonas sp. NPDC086251]
KTIPTPPSFCVRRGVRAPRCAQPRPHPPTGGTVGGAAANLKENVEALIADLKRIKPASSKGIYVKRVTLSTTMGPGLVIDQGSLDA